MSKARDEYYNTIVNCKYDAYKSLQKAGGYVGELEAENEKLKSYNQTEIDLSLDNIRLESEKAELIERFRLLLNEAKYIYQYHRPSCSAEKHFKNDIELLQKYMGEL